MYEPNIVAENIKKIAKSNSIQLKSMFLNLQLNKNTLSNMYKGSMLKGDSLARIADYLNCSVDYLLGRIETPETPEETTLLKIYHSLDEKKQHLALQKVLEIANDSGSEINK